MSSTAQITWVGPGLRLVGETASGQALVIDHALPGEERRETGPRPIELILIGMAGCTSMDIVSILQKKRQPIAGVQVRVSAERADEHPRVYTQIHLEYVVTGKGVSPQAVERSIELSQTKYCPGAAMLGKTVKITTAYRIVEE